VPPRALGFPFLVIVIDLADKFETYFGRGLSKARVAYSYVFFLPETISLVLPVAVLFAWCSPWARWAATRS